MQCGVRERVRAGVFYGHRSGAYAPILDCMTQRWKGRRRRVDQAACCRDRSATGRWRSRVLREMSQRRPASALSSSRALPLEILQLRQYSPLVPAACGLAASSAWVAAAQEAVLANSRAANPGVSRVRAIPGSTELTAMPRLPRRRESSLAYNAFASFDCA